MKSRRTLRAGIPLRMLCYMKSAGSRRYCVTPMYRKCPEQANLQRQSAVWRWPEAEGMRISWESRRHGVQLWVIKTVGNYTIVKVTSCWEYTKKKKNTENYARWKGKLYDWWTASRFCFRGANQYISRKRKHCLSLACHGFILRSCGHFPVVYLGLCS